MAKKPNCHELERRVKELEKEALERGQIEKALMESEKKLKAQYKNIPVPTYTWQMIGEDLVLTNFNDAAEGITKGRISEFLGIKAREMHQDMPEIQDDLTRCFSEKTVIEREMFYKLKSTGEEKNLAVKYAFVPPDSVLVHTEDITQRVEAEKKLKESHYELEKRVKERTRELANTIGVLEAEVADRKHAEEELRKSEEKYRLLAETAGELILTCDLEGRVTYVNKAGLEISGYSEEEALETNLADVLPEGQLEMFRERLARRMAGDTSCFLYETEFINREGNRIAIEVSSSLLTEDGEPSGVLVTGRDVSARKRAEEELRKSEEKYRKLYAESKRAEEVYRSLLHTSADAIVIYDLEGNARYINPSFTKIFGWRMEEVEGKRIPFLPESEKEETMALIMDLIENGTPCHGYETKRFTKDGRLLYVGISASRYDDQEGKPAGMLVTLRDISERKRLEAQLRHAQRMEALGTLAGGIAHDFNNLLMGIQGRTSLMLMDADFSHSHYEQLREIEDIVKSGADLTRQLLGFARKGKYEVRPVNLNLLIERNSQMFGRTKREIKIHTKYQKDLWSVDADAAQIEQVLLNLFVNAWQAMPGGGQLYLQTQNVNLNEAYVRAHEVDPGRYVRISIADTGTGMDRATQERIFDPFFTTRAMGRGTGLGLASAYGIIRNHGGIINLNSKLGEGTTFNIYLPASGKEIPEEKTITERFSTGTETILLVDDEDVVVDIGKKTLEKMGYHVLPARNGKEAIELYKQNQAEIDVVVLDMVMPEMGGGEVYDVLKEINPNAKVILSSGYSVEGEATEILERGCNGFVQKPFKPGVLTEKIREILGDN